MKTLTICLCLILAAGSVLAGKEARIARVDDLTIQPITLGEPTKQACLVGNVHQPCYACTGWIAGEETYKYIFWPGQDCAACPGGFRVTAVHIVLGFNLSMVPQSFPIIADLEDAVWSDEDGCWIPGVEDCVGDAYTVEITSVGTYDIAVPIGDCDCAFTNPDYAGPYFISIYFPEPLDANFYMDGMGGESCVAYNNWGSGWYDMHNVTGNVGDIVMWAELDCCNDPIPTEDHSWGAIKSLYR